MAWNIEPVNEYKAQSSILPFVGIIRKEYELRQQCNFILKKADFSWRQNVLLILLSQYWYQVIRKTSQSNKVPTKIYILSCAYTNN
jgi:hypothetical protein